MLRTKRKLAIRPLVTATTTVSVDMCTTVNDKQNLQYTLHNYGLVGDASASSPL